MMGNYWLDLIKREHDIENLRKEQEKREFESIMREHKLRRQIEIWKDSQKRKK